MERLMRRVGQVQSKIQIKTALELVYPGIIKAQQDSEGD